MTCRRLGEAIRQSPIVLKGATSRYFESFSATCKITFNLKETTKYWIGKIEKHQNGKNKPKGTRMVKDGED